jgi:hypothetical protein
VSGAVLLTHTRKITHQQTLYRNSYYNWDDRKDE